MLLEIRIHGRGGQGVVTAAQLLVEAAYYEGLWGQAIPFFGAERRGAPVVAYARISDKPIRIHSQIYSPDIVIVFDERLIKLANVYQGLRENGLLIVNTTKITKEIIQVSKEGKVRFAYTPATQIALDLKLIVAGWPVINTAMLGAFAKATKLVSINSIERAIKNNWPGKMGELNAKAARLAYEKTVLYGD